MRSPDPMPIVRMIHKIGRLYAPIRCSTRKTWLHVKMKLCAVRNPWRNPFPDNPGKAAVENSTTPSRRVRKMNPPRRVPSKSLTP